MYQNILACVASFILASTSVHGQEWARKMFKVTEHRFGTVARGSKTEFGFVLENSYQEDVHIASIRSSCGCATPEISKRNLKTWEKTTLLAKFNTRSFLGKKSATITVVFDKPYPAEVQLRISGNIRGDVVLRPGSVDYGEVGLGQAEERKVVVDYEGRGDWRLIDVRSSSHQFDARLREIQRNSGKVSYELAIGLKPHSKPGIIREQITLVTNDRKRSRIPLIVTGRILPAVTISPHSLALGVLRPDQVVTKQVVVRAKKPFKITSVDCDDSRLTFKTSAEAKRLHLIPVSFRSTEGGQSVKCRITVKTDLDSGAKASCTVTATVKSKT